MPRITNRNEFIEYCLRKLGHPVIEINVDVDQIEDRIDDAFEYYRDYHFDATERTFYSHQIQQADVDESAITLPDEMIFVKDVLAINGSGNSLYPLGDPSLAWDTTMNNPFSGAIPTSGHIGYTTMEQGGMGNSGKFDSLGYFLTMKNLQEIKTLFGTDAVPIRFNRHTNKIYFDIDSSQMNVGNYIIVEGWIILDPDVYNDVYNDRWLKRYATSLLKQQWGMNLSKYSNIALLGGVTLDGDKIYNMATEEIQKLEEEMQSSYSLPVDFMVG